MIDHDEIAARYERRYAERDYAEVEATLAKLVARGERVLDVGCGTGHWLERLGRWGSRGFGLDPSAEMLLRAAARPGDLALVRGSAEALPFGAASFDRVLAVQILHQLSDATLFVAEARRVLRSGGALVAVAIDPDAGADRSFVYDFFEGALDIDRGRHPTRATIRRWLDEAGFARVWTLPAGRARADVPARELLASGRLEKRSESLLSLVSEEVFRRGVERLQRAAEESEARGEALRLRVELHFYATVGVVPEAR